MVRSPAFQSSAVLFGECLASALKPASYLFRDPLGRVAYRVEQVAGWGLWSYSKLRALAPLELVWTDSWGTVQALLRRPPRRWRVSWELEGADGRTLFSFVPVTFLGGRWTLTDQRTGQVVAGKVRNPLVVGPQEAGLFLGDGRTVALLRWSEFSWRLGCPSRVRIELADRGWELAAVGFAVIRWTALQQR